jgi:hypothetical protein
VIPPPASSQFGAVHLFPGGTGIPRGDDGVVFINDDSPKIPAEAGALVCTPEGEIKEVLVAVGSHHREIYSGTGKKYSTAGPEPKWA